MAAYRWWCYLSTKRNWYCTDCKIQWQSVYTVTILARVSTLQLVACRALLFSTTTHYLLHDLCFISFKVILKSTLFFYDLNFVQNFFFWDMKLSGTSECIGTQKVYVPDLKLLQRDVATLRSILNSQLSWESGKFQLARWSHRVVILGYLRWGQNPIIWVCFVFWHTLVGILQEIIPLRGSILQAETCQILRLAENPRWSRVWQYL